MKFFDFFRKTKLKGEEQSVSGEQVASEKKENPVTNKKKANQDIIQTPLSLHPDWNISQEQMYVFRFLANDLAPLRPNQISLQGIDIDFEEGRWLVKAFIRSTVEQMIEIGEVGLILLDKEDKMIGHQQFDLSELGDIPSNTARPWVFEFRPENLFVEDIEQVPEDGWKLAFDLSSMREHQLDVDPRWRGELTKEQTEALEEVVSRLAPLPERQLNLTGFLIEEYEGGYAASIFIRSSHPKAMNIEKLPLQLLDANGEVAAEGSFHIEPALEIRPNTSKPWSFIFPKETVTKENADFSRWAVRLSPNAQVE